jgi:hypothetical protein
MIEQEKQVKITALAIAVIFFGTILIAQLSYPPVEIAIGLTIGFVTSLSVVVVLKLDDPNI